LNTDVLVPAALEFVREINERFPNRGTESDGSLAGSAHSAANPTSDHEHGTRTPGDRDVDAVDLDSDLIPGSEAASKRWMYGLVIPAFQAHAGTQYWIHDDMICHRSEGWEPRSYKYAGPNRNRHTHHAHFNWQEDSASHNNRSPYGIVEAEMAFADEKIPVTATTGKELFDPDRAAGTEVYASTVLQLAAIHAGRAARDAAAALKLAKATDENVRAILAALTKDVPPVG
jgi:hypothetical protein